MGKADSQLTKESVLRSIIEAAGWDDIRYNILFEMQVKSNDPVLEDWDNVTNKLMGRT